MTSQVKPIPAGYHTVTPYLIVQEAEKLVDFVKQAFEAVEHFRGTGSAGGLHIEVSIGDSRVMIGGGGAWSGEPASGPGRAMTKVVRRTWCWRRPAMSRRRN